MTQDRVDADGLPESRHVVGIGVGDGWCVTARVGEEWRALVDVVHDGLAIL